MSAGFIPDEDLPQGGRKMTRRANKRIRKYRSLSTSRKANANSIQIKKRSKRKIRN